MMKPTPFPHSLVVADIHLQPQAPLHPINQTFKRFLTERAAQAEKLFILGDLFDAWLGDDLSLADFYEEIEALRQLKTQGVKVFIQYGNRDFLMRDAFWQATGAIALRDESALTLYHQPILMLHGDQLCTEDKAYQRLRFWIRQPWVQWLFLRLSAAKRRKIGTKMRHQSHYASSLKNPQSMDVSQPGLAYYFARFPKQRILIHGHTHLPADHLHYWHDQPIQRYVLSDWRPEGDYLCISNTGIQRHAFS
ncbi:MAG: UDP-2,3-diacylglucosamine diphosphatase [Thiotrichales bacterium]|nr:UDP-2,3-diacylglucosamine diphosphatase [Thiotrichales bacterium]